MRIEGVMEYKRTAQAALLLTILSTVLCKKIAKLNVSEAFDNTWPAESELENELEQKRAKNAVWSTWSEWTTCSRSCDGGISQQLRRCHAPNGCRGETTRYKICNMQQCPEAQDFRAHQCAAYDDVPYDGTLFKWTPHYDYVEPCALTCRGKPAHLVDDESAIERDEDDSEPFDEPSVIVQLSSRVQDGTRCRTGSLDMCIQGKCQRVGCDLKIGSTKKVDACGVCGGDGSSCSQPLYHWEIAPMSLCSVTCGGGYKMSQPTCKNRVTGSEVNESLCSATSRPEPSVVKCNTHLCPAKWIVDEWRPCNRLCGGGYRERVVVCAEESNEVLSKVPDEVCRTAKPPIIEACNIHECPKWVTSEWSGCSVSCGTGIQMREVECINSRGILSSQCEPQTRPSELQPCNTGIQCYSEALVNEPETNSKSEEIEGSEQDSYNDQPYYSHRQTHTAHHEELPPVAEQLIGEEASSEPSFIKDPDWSPCSVTCGEGIRKRLFRCKIFLEFSRTVATLNDTLCEGPKPQDEIENCIEAPCPLAYGYDESFPRDSIKVGVSEPGKTYIWHEQGYTSCSASCLGGVEELIINCVREDSGKVVSPFLCSPETKPEARVRTCNDRPCPPRWNYSDYSPCSKSCGIGIKTREVQCIHEVTRGGENTMVVPNNMCPQPPPADRQYCNVLDCPVRWEVSEWSKCSQSCGYGIKERKVECKQIMAQEHKIERPESMCPSSRPTNKKPCNIKPCPPMDPSPAIDISNSTYIQHDPKKNKITLKVGGAAEVFFGTQVKIKCPVKRYNRTKIQWSKDQRPLSKSRKFKTSKKGALRILDITFRDAGLYTCHAGHSTADINIEVKAKPGGVQPNEDYDRYRDDSDRSVRERSETEYLTASSNEEKSPSSKKKQRGRNRHRSDGMQHADSSIMKDESQPNGDLHNGFPQTAASSSGSRTARVPSMHYFQALLPSLQFSWPFKSFGDSQGRHFLVEKIFDFGIDIEQLEKDEPVKRINTTDILNPTTENGIFLGVANKSDVIFEWLTTPWSTCSQTCGTNEGLRKRSVHCMVRVHNFTQNVDNALCEDAGLKIPDTFESCGNDECPLWITSMWSLCQQSRCQGRNKAIQRREVICKFTNDTISNKCDDAEQPIDRQECYNELCKGVWRVEPWSECNAQCGSQGLKYRILQCVWYGTRKPAGDACRNQPRPAVMKVCKGPSCMSNLTECKDKSRYCRNVRAMGLCRLQHYQLSCCKSCRLNTYN